MPLIRDRSIKTKLLWLSAASVTVAICLSCVGFTVNEVRTMRAFKVDELKTQAEMLAFNSTAVLSFREVSAAQNLLASLRSQPAVEFACLYDVDGRVLATYPRDAGRDSAPAPHAGDDCRLTTAWKIGLFRQVLDRGERVGTLYLRANMDAIWRHLLTYAAIALGVVCCSITASVLLAVRLQRTISEPILKLVRTAEQVTSTADYSIRVEHNARDELGTLCAQFNSMLDRVETSDRALKQSHEELESRVAARTRQLQEEIARRETTQIELLQAKNSAEAANIAKSRFLANMSHELRTPMTAILGFADVLLGSLGESAPAEHLDAAQTIKRNGEHLLGILSDILDLSKIEAGKLEVQRESCSLCQILADVVSLIRVRAVAKGLMLSLEYVGSIPTSIVTDPLLVRQILFNLVGNAIKFTEVGGVYITARVARTDSLSSKLQIDVRDTGIGITDAQRENLFRPFSQADTSTSRRFGGTGLGLAISMRAAEMLGGTISIKSTPGGGSVFIVTIDAGTLDGVRMLDAPAEVGCESPSGDRNPGGQELKLDCRILLVEDGLDNQRLLSFLLRKAGAEVVVADNGQIAVEKVATLSADGEETRHGQEEPFDLILMDMQMPVLDGYGATSQLREMGYRNPIIALTAHAMTADREKCLDAGCDGYISKPVDRATLLTTVAQYLARPAATDAAAEPPFCC